MSYFAFVKKSDPQYKGYSDEQIATAIQSIDPEFSGAKPAEVMDILNSMDEGGSRQYHESLWDKVPKEPAAAPEPAQEPTRTPEPQGLGEVGAMDYVYAAARGAGELPVALGWLVKKIPGLESAGKSIQEVGDTAVKYWEEQLSPAAKAEMTKEFVRYNEETGEYELGEAGWHTAGLTASGSLASSVAGMGIGGAVTKGMLAAIPTRAGLKAVGTGGAASNIATRATTTGLPARGALATKMKAEAAKKLGRQESIAGAIGFGAGEGAISGVMSAKEVEEEILKTDPKKLVTVPEFQELYHSPEMADLPHKERFEATRAEMASRGSTEAGWTAGLTTALLGAPLGAAFGRALFGKRPISDTRLKSAVFGGLGEAAQEAVQSGAEQAIQNRAVQQYADPTRDIGKGVVSSAVSGAAAGGVMGGTIGAVTGGQPQLPAPEDAEQPKSMKDKEIDEGAQKAATSVENQEKQPTEAQKKSGNYKKGPVTVHGMKVSVENPKGSIRSGVSGDGTQWDRQMTAHYGYVKGTDAADGDQVDAFVSGEGPIHIVDQVNPETGEFDEHKVIIGPETQEEAAALYRSNYEPGWQGLGAINPVSVEEFKGWKSDKSKTKQPFVVAKAGTTTGVPDARGVTWKGKAVVTPAATEVPPTGVPEGVPDGALAPDAAAVEPVAPAAPAPAAAPAAPIVTPESQPAVAPEVPEAAAPAPVVTPVAPAPGAPPVAAQETTTVTPAQEETPSAQEQPSKPLRQEGQEAGQPSEPVRGVPDVDQAVVPDRQAAEEKDEGAPEQTKRITETASQIAGGTNTRVFLSDLHDALPDLTPDQINQAILGMADNGQAALYPIENPRELTEARGRDPIIAGGEANQIVYFEPEAGEVKTDVQPETPRTEPEPETKPVRMLDRGVPAKSVTARKLGDGQYGLFYSGTATEVFPDEPRFKSGAVARRFFKEKNEAREIPHSKQAEVLSANVESKPPEGSGREERKTEKGVVESRGEEKAEEKAEGEQPKVKKAVARVDGLKKLSDDIAARLLKQEKTSWQQLFSMANKAFGGKQSEGAYSPKDAYDAMELGLNKAMFDISQLSDEEQNAYHNGSDTADPAIDALENLMGLLPTQTKRTQKQDELQQYSTPPTHAFAATWVANVSPNDVVLEPSAGTGSLAVHPQLAGVKKENIHVNELDPGRAETIGQLFPNVTSEDAMHLHSVLPKDVKPTVVIMNPPFSANVNMPGKKDVMVGAKHVEQALKRMEPGGRLVAIVGRGMAPDAPRFRKWWRGIEGDYNVRANVGISGEEYRKFGTTFDNRILVIDKTGPTTGTVVTGEVDKVKELIPLLDEVRNERVPAGERAPAESDVEAAAGATAAKPGRRGAVRVTAGESQPAETDGRVEDQPAGRDQVDGRPADDRGAGTGDEVPAGDGGRAAGGVQPGQDQPVEEPGRPDAAVAKRVEGPDGGRAAGVKVTNVSPDGTEIGGSTFEQYRPSVQIEGSKPHPTKLSESAAMASVAPPDATYQPSIDQEIIESGKLSDTQLESITRAGEAHGYMLPSGERKGFFIGDGCVAAGTRIFNPDTGEHTPIEELMARGGDHKVLSLTSEGFVSRIAKCPFEKGVDSLFKVSLESGRQITVTANHKFLTPDGWKRMVDGLAVGDSVACASNAQTIDDLNSSRKAEDCLDDCYPYPQSESRSDTTERTGQSSGQLFCASSVYHSRFDRISALEPAGFETFYDMYVPGTENYVAEDIVSHNTGLGKGAQIAGVIADNRAKGRKKAVWVSENAKLFNDAQRDAEWVGMDPKLLVKQSGVKGPIKTEDGILFTTYDTLRSASKEIKDPEGNVVTPAKARLDQLVDWLGEDFDGVIAFDEAHNMANAVDQKGGRGIKKASAKALAGIDLQKRLPKARVVYVSATGATEVANLGYADRLGLWGEGTPFADKHDFINNISSGGVSAMEVVAKDMKSMGLYTSRALSYDDVTYDTIVQNLSPEQRKTYDELARAWQGVLQDVNAALGETGANDNGRARSAALSAFWGGHQRFFNQALTGMQMPAAIKDIEQQIEDGNSAVLQLVNTNEAVQERRMAQAAEAGVDLEDVDITPKDILMQYVARSFPTTQFEEYTDEDGNTRTRPVTDSKGNPVENAEAVERKEQLLDKLGALKVPEGPLEQVINHFGPDQVAEITGRKRRLVRMPDGKVVEQKLGVAKSNADAKAFMDDKKRILIFSDAGGTGRSYHADKRAKNQRKRIHYLIQPGWRADKAVQGTGRTHRTNQASAPEYKLVTTDIKAQRRFISTIARRLDQLGALTKGQREATSQGMFDSSMNLENEYGEAALETFIEDLNADKIDGLTMAEFQEQTGLELLDEQGNLKDNDSLTVPRFLNRLLSLEIEPMNRVFDAFMERLDATVEYARSQGTLDTGMETIRADAIRKVSDEVVPGNEGAVGQTRFVKVELDRPATKIPFSQLPKGAKFARNKRSKKLYAFTDAQAVTDPKTGDIVERWRRIGQSGGDYIRKADANTDKYAMAKESQEQLRDEWTQAVKALPDVTTETKNLVTGTLLPVWDRLPSRQPKIVRMRTDDGETLLGREISGRDVKPTMKALGLSVDVPRRSPQQWFDRVLASGDTLTLANGWQIQRRRISGDPRIEVVGPSMKEMNVIRDQGGMIERINFKTRVFLPTDNPDVFARVLANRPVVDVNEESRQSVAEPKAEARPKPKAKPKPKPLPNAMSVAEVNAAIRPLVGKTMPDWLNVVQTQEQVPESVRRGNTIAGAFDPATGQSYIVADQMHSPEQARGVLLHEVGVHAGLKKLLGDKQYDEVARQIQEMRARGQVEAVEAFNRVPDDVSEKNVTEEAIAYLVENRAARKLPIWRRITRAIRARLVSEGYFTERTVKDLTPEDLVVLATAAVRARTRQQWAMPRSVGEIELDYEEFDVEEIEITGLGEEATERGAEESVDRLRENPTLLGNRVVKDFDDKSKADLLGQKIESAGDLATLGQVYRNPMFETLRLFFMKGNRVVGQTGVTSRMPGQSAVWSRDVTVKTTRESMENLGADGYYLLHNHPSGRADPSQSDADATKSIAELIPGFRGHVVIDHIEYGVVRADGSTEVFPLRSETLMDEGRYGPGSPTKKSHKLLGVPITGPRSLAKLGAEVTKGADRFQLVGRDAKGAVSGIMDVPVSYTTRRRLRLLAEVKQFQKQTSSIDVFATNVPDFLEPMMADAIRTDVIKDAIVLDRPESIRDLGLEPSPGMDSGRRARKGYSVVGEPLEGAKYSVPPQEPVEFNPVTEERFTGAREGLADQRSMLQRVKEFGEHLKAGFTRHHIELPNIPEFAKAKEILRHVEAGPQATKEQAMEDLERLVRGMSPDDYDLFTRKVIVDDQMYELDQNHKLTMGWTKDTLLADKAKVDAAVAKNPVVQRAVSARLKNLDAMKKRLQDAGILGDEADNPAYFHHQVLTYARARKYGKAGVGAGQVKKPRYGSFMKRWGSDEDINANFLEAEFEYLQQSMMGLRMVEAIERIHQDYDKMEEAKSVAREQNNRRMQDVFEAEKMPDGSPGPAEAAFKTFNQRMAISAGKLEKMAQQGDLDYIPMQYQGAVEDMAAGESAGNPMFFPTLGWLAENGQDAEMVAARTFLAAANAKRAHMRAVLGDDYAETRILTMRDAENLVKSGSVPENYRVWQPEKGSIWYKGSSLSEEMLQNLNDLAERALTPQGADTQGLPQGIDPNALLAALEQVRSVTMKGSAKRMMLLPTELADTLDQMTPETEGGLFDAVFAAPLRMWKQWILINPRRFAKYNLNNMSGDLDAAIAAGPKMLKHMPGAIKEIWQAMRPQGTALTQAMRKARGKAPLEYPTPSEQFQRARDMGVFDAGLTMQEIPDINLMDPFAHLIGKTDPLKQPIKFTKEKLYSVWKVLRDYTRFRENWLRYAAFKYYEEQLNAGKTPGEFGYGASSPAMIDELMTGDKSDVAGLLARDAIGDYGDVSSFGLGIRKYGMPFYSWMEVNTKRYIQLFRNAWNAGDLSTAARAGQMAQVTGGLALKGAMLSAHLYLRMFTLMMLVHAWNNLVHPDEEDELSTDERVRLHINLGRDEDGQVRLIRFQGALSDFLQWFGFNEAAAALLQIESGRADFTDVAEAVAKGAPNKIASGISPVFKTPTELLAGQSFWPDAFNPRPIRDRERAVARLFSLEHEFDQLTGRPTRGYLESWEQAITYKKDAGELAYNKIIGMAYDFRRKQTGEEGSGYRSTPRSHALRLYKLALRYGDTKAAEKYLREYKELGGTARSLRGSIKRAHPIGPVLVRDRAKFVNQLSAGERQTYKQALEWYRDVFL